MCGAETARQAAAPGAVSLPCCATGIQESTCLQSTWTTGDLVLQTLHLCYAQAALKHTVVLPLWLLLVHVGLMRESPAAALDRAALRHATSRMLFLLPV